MKFHFTLCVPIDFYWSLDKISQDIVKRLSPLCTHCLEKDREMSKVFFSRSVDTVGDRAKVCVCVLYFTFTLRGLSLGLLRCSEAQGFAQRARPRHADGLDMHNVVCLLLQVP